MASHAVRVTIIGHASTRWRAAKNRKQADRLNQALSNRRAENVRAAVERILKREIPNVEIMPGESLADGQRPTGINVGSYGVGSREPVLNLPPDPAENNALNRSVTVLLELTSTESG